jgi:DNA-binding LacI/PurR family transcriptional regulator
MSQKLTMTDIARQAGVSKNTVSLALRNDSRIPAGTRNRIQEIAERLGYRKNPTIAHLMVQLRANRTKSFAATLALLNGNRDPEAFRKHPTVPRYVEGCRRRALQLGYTLDEFWLHDPRLDGERLNRILHTRGIRGVIVAGLMHENHLPARFLPTWQNFPCVVTGVRTRDPSLSFASTDQHMLTLRAVENVLRLGYQRPALVLDHVIDRLIEGRFTSGMLIGQQNLPATRRLRPFYKVKEAHQNRALFHEWFVREKPDVILTLYHDVMHWLKGMHIRVPEDIGVVQLEWREDHPELAGMNQHNDVTGEAAAEMVISMIYNGECGIPVFPRATFIDSTWVNGKTVNGQIPTAV